MTKKELAIDLHNRGCNCAQSVACAFSEECGTDTETLMKLAEGFGFGCGGTEGMCGALSGAIMVAGCRYADGNAEKPRSKPVTYSVAKRLCSDFKEACGALTCGEIKGIASGKPLTPCGTCIEVGVQLVEKILEGSYDN